MLSIWNKLGRLRVPSHSSTTTKTSVATSRSPQIVSQSQPVSRSTSPHSLKSSHHLSSLIRTPTTTRSRIPIGSRISSRESSPGRTRMYFICLHELLIALFITMR